MNLFQQDRELFLHTKLTLAFSAALTLSPIALLASPTGGEVVSGSAQIGQSGAVTNIIQHTPKAAIDWQGFSVGSNETVKFHQPNSSSITLNRVLGNERSVIDGALNANGQIFLVNSNGILFTKGSSVNAAGLVASTLDISNKDFESNRFVFQGGGGGSVINMGTLSAVEGGYVTLLGKEVLNEGVILATRGTAALSAGEQITLNFNGNSLLNVSIDQGAFKALVENRQAIIADGGKVFLTARAADELLGSQVNNSGVIEAHTVGDLKGEIVAHAYGGSALIEGTLDASAPNGGDGGSIETSGEKVNITDNVRITTYSASGKTGNWLIDPDDFTIAASGGNITGKAVSNALASNNLTLSSTQGNGNNGDLNVNDRVNWTAKTTLGLTATHSINLNAQVIGANGGLTLQAGSDANFNALSSANVASLTAKAGGNVNFNAPQFWAASGTLSFTGKNINVNDALRWSDGLVTLKAAQFINLNAVMTVSNNARLVASYNSGRDTSLTRIDPKTNLPIKGAFEGVSHGILVPSTTYGTPLGGINALFDDKKQEFVGRIDFAGNHANNPLTINGNPYTLITSIGGSGVHDLSLIDANEGKGFYALATDLIAPSTAFSKAPVLQLGGYDINTGSTTLAGLEGLGHAIRNLKIETQVDYVDGGGLIGKIQRGSSVSNVNVVNNDITAPKAEIGNFGALAGRNDGAINNAYASGKVSVTANEDSNPDSIGGLVGFNVGTIYHSGANVDVTTKNAKTVGGFVGFNIGLPGFDDFGKPNLFGIILESYAKGALHVTMSNPNLMWDSADLGGFGGFVGTNFSLISGSSSSGAITAVLQLPSGQSSSLMGNIGGFAGVNSEGFGTNAVISNSTSSSSVTSSVIGGIGSFNGVGGFVGQNGTTDHATVINSSAFGKVKVGGVDQESVGGFAGINPGGSFNGNTYNSTTTGQDKGIGFNSSNSNSGISNTSNTQASSTQGRQTLNQGQLARDARAQAQALTGQIAAQEQAAAQAVVASTASQLGSTRLAEVQRNTSIGGFANTNFSSAPVPSDIDDHIFQIEPSSYSAHVQSIEVDGVTYDLDEEDEKGDNPE